MSASLRWSEWRQRLSQPTIEGQFPWPELRAVASEVSATIGGEGGLVKRWQRAGVEVRVQSMRSRGRCDLSSPRPVVFVREEPNEATQHFTVAHEVAHLLIDALPAEALRGVGHNAEESLCNSFARDVLVPPGELIAELDGKPNPSLAAVLGACGMFRANPSVVLAALAELDLLSRHSYLIARRRGHYRRPEVIDFRISASAAERSLYWPRRRRLRGLGLVNLTEAAMQAEHASFFVGADSSVVVPRRRLDPESGHNAMSGPVSWEATLQGKREELHYVLTRVDCTRLDGVRVTRAEKRPSASGVDREPGAVGVRG